LVERVTLLPDGNELGIVLNGDLAAILSFAAGKTKPDLLPEAGLLGDLVSIVGCRDRI
jgi:site-specific DNA recombinase